MRRFLTLLALLAAVPALARPPRLAVVLAVDSLGSDALLRNRPRLKKGLATLLDGGAFFPYARYAFAEPSTGPGHATLSTGANPWRHGVVSNRIFNRATLRVENIYADPSHPVLEAPLSPTEDVSPERLAAETLADRVRLSTQGRGKVVSLSGKARAAVSLAGRMGQAWWFHDQVGRFVTGTWYAKEFPTWVRAFNEKRPADRYHGKTWTLALPEKEYVGEDDRPFETDHAGLGRTFPHPLRGGAEKPGPQSYLALVGSPYLNELLVDFARAALEAEKLGQDGVPDVLAVSFSGVDNVYHAYGPYSLEYQDALVRLDAQVATLLEAAAKAAGGKENLVVVLTGDHGGAAIPEEWAAAGMPASRVDSVRLQEGLRKELSTRFSVDVTVSVDETDVYLAGKALEDKRVDMAAVRRAAAQWLEAQPHVRAAVAKDDLASAPDRSGVMTALRKGFYPGRSGDVLLVLEPFHVFMSGSTGTNHGMPYAYDSQVPAVFYGRGVKPGVYRQDIDATDIAPTLAALLEVGMPAEAEGTVRAEALTSGK
ncbi:MAG: alkaline phosphatase family protein [Myxococcaceae bacterium]|nr:alkaline phosphatase family protein [Myxococcaceae bacterium]